MYCPKCGREMLIENGVYKCKIGDMILSKKLHDELSKLFPMCSSQPNYIKVGADIEQWFCPGCGIPISENMECNNCGKSLEYLRFQLIELHTHI